MDHRKDDEDSSVLHEPDFFDRVFADIDRFSLRLWTRCGLKIVLVPLIYLLYVYVIGGVVFSLIERPTGCGFLEWPKLLKQTSATLTDNCFLDESGKYNESIWREWMNLRYDLTKKELELAEKCCGEKTGLIVTGKCVSLKSEVCSVWGNVFSTAFISFTAITTIGNNDRPKTIGGKLYLIFYSIIGIPMTACVIAMLISTKRILLNFLFRRIVNLRKYRRCKCRAEAYFEELVVCVILIVPYVVIPPIMIRKLGFYFHDEGTNQKYTRDYDGMDGIFDTFATLAAMGFNGGFMGWGSDMFISRVDRQGLNALTAADKTGIFFIQVCSMVWTLFGQAYLLILVSYIAKYVRNLLDPRPPRRPEVEKIMARLMRGKDNSQSSRQSREESTPEATRNESPQVSTTKIDSESKTKKILEECKLDPIFQKLAKGNKNLSTSEIKLMRKDAVDEWLAENCPGSRSAEPKDDEKVKAVVDLLQNILDTHGQRQGEENEEKTEGKNQKSSIESGESQKQKNPLSKKIKEEV